MPGPQNNRSQSDLKLGDGIGRHRAVGKGCLEKGATTMYHTIEFVAEVNADLEISPKQPLERMRIEKGDSRRVQIKPYIMEADKGPVEVADLFFEDGTTIRHVPFASFCFVD